MSFSPRTRAAPFRKSWLPSASLRPFYMQMDSAAIDEFLASDFGHNNKGAIIFSSIGSIATTFSRQASAFPESQQFNL